MFDGVGVVSVAEQLVPLPVILHPTSAQPKLNVTDIDICELYARRKLSTGLEGGVGEIRGEVTHRGKQWQWQAVLEDSSWMGEYSEATEWRKQTGRGDEECVPTKTTWV